MHPMGVAFGVALAGALVLTPLARAFAVRLRIVDQPDGRRKLQKRPIPLFGGVAVYLALVLGLSAVNFTLGNQYPALRELSQVLISATGFVCLFGCLDDTWDLSPRFKLLLQVCSVLPIVLEGYALERVSAFGYPFELGWLGVPLTVLWLVGCINALNLLDGMDGLASLVGLCTAAMLAIIAMNLDHGHVAILSIALAGALAGFLIYNLPPASIYLGDSGSMVIGMAVGILGMQATLKTPATLAITAPAVLMCIPMLDTLLAIIRRKLTGQRFDTADRGHIHHRLLERGLNNWQALGVIGLLCLMTGSAAAAAIILRSDGLAWAIALSLVVILIRLRVFGHHELALIKLTLATAMVRLVHRLFGPFIARRNGAGLDRGLPFEHAWPALIEQGRGWSLVAMELTSRCNPRPPARHTWQSATPGNSSAFVVSFLAEETSCEVRVHLEEPHNLAFWEHARMVQAIAAFCQYWATHAELVPESAHWLEGPDGHLVCQPAALTLHDRAKAA